MRQYTKREFVRILESNNYLYTRSKGSHDIYYNDKGVHISVPRAINACIARRLIKEHKLNVYG